MPNPYAGGKDYGDKKKKKFPFPETPGGGKAPSTGKAPPMKDKTRMQAEEVGRSYNKGSGMAMARAKMKKKRSELE